MTRTITPSCRAALYYTPKQYFDYNILAVAKFSRKELLNWKKRFLVFEVRWMSSFNSFISSVISFPIHWRFSIVKIIFCSRDWSFFIVEIIFCWLLSMLKSSWEQHPPSCCFFPETLDFPVCWISVRLVWGLSSCCDHLIFLLAIKIRAWLHCGWWWQLKVVHHIKDHTCSFNWCDNLR